MNCTQCKTAKEILAWIRSIDQWCSKKVDRFNRVLRNFYLDTRNVPLNLVAQAITQEWLHTIQTDYPIYKVFGFFGNWCSKNYIHENNALCWQDISMLKMFQVDWANLKTGQYKRICDTEINANIPNWIKDGYFVYSRWPISISGMNEEICMDPMMLTWFEYMLEKFYWEVDENVNTRETARQNYKDWIDSIKDAADTVTFSIETGINYNSPRN